MERKDKKYEMQVERKETTRNETTYHYRTTVSIFLRHCLEGIMSSGGIRGLTSRAMKRTGTSILSTISATVLAASCGGI